MTRALPTAKLPREMTEQLSREINLVLRRDEVREGLAELGFAVRGSSPEGLAQSLREQLVAWRQGIREAGIPQE